MKAITLYSKPACPHCDSAKLYLTNHGFEFNVIDVTQDEKALEFIKSRGARTVPQLYVGETILVEGGNAGLQKLSADEIRQRIADIS